MDKVVQFDYLELFFSENIGLYESTEIINLADFTIIASNIFEESDDSTIFLVQQVYSKSSLNPDCGDRIFDYRETSTVGVWQNNLLMLYQQISSGYLRMIYFVERQGKAKIYRSLIETSSDGNLWKRYALGKYGWV